eukprot:291373-Pleurochrysis_carterae.AAC.4
MFLFAPLSVPARISVYWVGCVAMGESAIVWTLSERGAAVSCCRTSLLLQIGARTRTTTGSRSCAAPSFYGCTAHRKPRAAVTMPSPGLLARISFSPCPLTTAFPAFYA